MCVHICSPCALSAVNTAQKIQYNFVLRSLVNLPWNTRGLSPKIFWLHGTSLVVQQLRLSTSNVRGTGWIPDWGTKIPYASSPKKKDILTSAYTIYFMVPGLVHDQMFEGQKFQRKKDSSWYQPHGNSIYATYVDFFFLPPTLCPGKKFWILRLTAVCYASAETVAKKLEGSFCTLKCKFYHGINLFQTNCQLNSGWGEGINLRLMEAHCWYEGTIITDMWEIWLVSVEWWLEQALTRL